MFVDGLPGESFLVEHTIMFVDGLPFESFLVEQITHKSRMAFLVNQFWWNNYTHVFGLLANHSWWNNYTQLHTCLWMAGESF